MRDAICDEERELDVVEGKGKGRPAAAAAAAIDAIWAAMAAEVSAAEASPLRRLPLRPDSRSFSRSRCDEA